MCHLSYLFIRPVTARLDGEGLGEDRHAESKSSFLHSAGASLHLERFPDEINAPARLARIGIRVY